MKQQMIISSTSASDFESRVNKAVLAGWRVLPESIKTSSSSSASGSEYLGAVVSKVTTFVCLLEWPENTKYIMSVDPAYPSSENSKYTIPK